MLASLSWLNDVDIEYVVFYAHSCNRRVVEISGIWQQLLAERVALYTFSYFCCSLVESVQNAMSLLQSVPYFCPVSLTSPPPVFH